MFMKTLTLYSHTHMHQCTEFMETSERIFTTQKKVIIAVLIPTHTGCIDYDVTDY